MSDFNSLVQYTVENISRPIKYIIYKLTEFIRVVDKFVFRQVPSGAASGYATIEQIEGNTVKFNQLVNISIYGSGQDFTLNNSTQEIIFNLSSYTNSNKTLPNNIIVNPIVGHSYFVKNIVVQGNFSGRFGIRYGEKTTAYITSGITSNNGIISPISTQNIRISIGTDGLVITTKLKIKINIIDLTLIFGAGNEPSTVADFEAWMAQNIGTLPYYDYNAGELLSCKMSGMQTQDSSQQTLDTIALDVTTITGINTATNVREAIFPNGMKQADYAGTVKDTLDLLRDKATVKVGSRAYQAGDESDTDVITDGTTTYYALTTLIEYTDLQDGNGNPLNPRYKVEQGGTEQVLPVNNSTPTTVAPTLTTTYTKDNN